MFNTQDNNVNGVGSSWFSTIAIQCYSCVASEDQQKERDKLSSIFDVVNSAGHNLVYIIECGRALLRFQTTNEEYHATL